MKKLVLILICVISMFALTACNSSTPVQLLLRQNWLQNDDSKTEKLSYTVSKAGSDVKGEYVQTYKKVNQATVGSKNFEDISGYLVESKLTFDSDVVETAVLFSAGSAKSEVYPPIASFKKSFINGVYRVEQIVYNNGEAQYSYADAQELGENPTTSTASISTPYYDNQQLYTILRAATLGTTFSFGFSTVIPAENGVVKLSCAFGNTETLAPTVNDTAQSYSCTKINIVRDQKITGKSSSVWLSGKIIVNSNTYTQVPVKISEGDFEYLLKGLDTL